MDLTKYELLLNLYLNFKVSFTKGFGLFNGPTNCIPPFQNGCGERHGQSLNAYLSGTNW